MLPPGRNPVLESRKKARAEVEVPIHEQTTQDKSFEIRFHTCIIGRNRVNLHNRTALRAGNMRSFLSAFLTVLYPHRCLGCRAEVDSQQYFCDSCQPFIHQVESPLCPCCGLPFTTTIGPDHLCSRCAHQPPAFRQARAWALYQAGGSTPQPLSEAIQHFKYQRRLSTGKLLATLAADNCPFAEHYDFIIPVPLHIERLRWRGFNQSLLLAQTIGRKKQNQVNPFLLERIRPTAPQTQLNEKERRTNVRGAFAVSAPAQLQGATLLLIDDVYTSGSTLNECARVLRRSGAAAVDVFTLARAVLR